MISQYCYTVQSERFLFPRAFLDIEAGVAYARCHCDWPLYLKDLVKVWHKQNGVRTDHFRIARPQQGWEEVPSYYFSVKFFSHAKCFKASQPMLKISLKPWSYTDGLDSSVNEKEKESCGKVWNSLIPGQESQASVWVVSRTEDCGRNLIRTEGVFYKHSRSSLGYYLQFMPRIERTELHILNLDPNY